MVRDQSIPGLQLTACLRGKVPVGPDKYVAPRLEATLAARACVSLALIKLCSR